MRLCFALFIFSLLFQLSCAKKLNQASETYAPQEESYLSCNLFGDETFRGYAWRAPYETDNCVYLDINESPSNFLTNYNLFLQIYPFSAEGEEIEYGSSLPIQTIQRALNKEDQEPLILSQIIDLYLVEEKLKLEPSLFFVDHFLEVCDVGANWQGLQLVIYERQGYNKPSLPIRKTKLLIPPFLIHPEHYRDEEGPALAVFHPFFELITEYQSQPDAYYDLANKFCKGLSGL